MASMRWALSGISVTRPCCCNKLTARRGFVLRKVFDGSQQLRVFLAHDLVELRGLHPGLLHLLEGLASFDTLMLASVSDQQNSILRANLLHEIVCICRVPARLDSSTI